MLAWLQTPCLRDRNWEPYGFIADDLRWFERTPGVPCFLRFVDRRFRWRVYLTKVLTRLLRSICPPWRSFLVMASSGLWKVIVRASAWCMMQTLTMQLHVSWRSVILARLIALVDRDEHKPSRSYHYDRYLKRDLTAETEWRTSARATMSELRLCPKMSAIPWCWLSWAKSRCYGYNSPFIDRDDHV